jgi:type VI secretion system ImpB/VipA family protein
MPGESSPSASKINFEVNLAHAPRTQRQSRVRDASSPFGMLLVGNFSGNSNRAGLPAIAQRGAWAVDSDNFETVVGRLAPGARLETNPGHDVSLQFASVEDFHPDSLLAHLPRLQVLVQQRRRLREPKTAAAAAEALGGLLATPPPATAPARSENAPAPPPQAESADETLARLLGGAPRPAAAQPSGKPRGLDTFIKGLVSSSAVPAATPQQTALLSLVDLELTNGLRAVLHHPVFQELEAAWRGVDRLVRLFGGEENIKLYIADIAQEELASGVGLSEFFRRQTDEHELALCLALYNFGADAQQIDALGTLLEAAAASGLLLLSAASPSLIGCESIETQTAPEDWRTPLPADAAKAWQTLRARPEADRLGLAMPRFLLRQPYGRQGEPLESFPFEELLASSTHAAYLWGNPTIACGQLIAEAFLADGWEMQLSGYGEVGDIPVHRFTSDEGTKVKPCAEAWLSERAGEAISEKGFIPLLSVKGRDAVLVPRLQSVTQEGLALPSR